MKVNSRILSLMVLLSFIGASYAAIGYDFDRDGVIDVVVPGNGWRGDRLGAGRAGPRRAGRADEWAVVGDGWRGAKDWNRDGIIDWKDDWAVEGARPWSGDWARADWNRDGVIDSKDGWRRLGGAIPVDSWDNSWRTEPVTVRGVGAAWNDGLRVNDGPWDSYGWGGAWAGDWNRDGVVDWQDDWAWRDGLRGDWAAAPVVVSEPWRGDAWRGDAWRGDAWRGDSWGAAPRVISEPWRGDAWRGDAWRGDSWGAAPVVVSEPWRNESVRVREVPAGSKTTATVNPGTTKKPATQTSNTGSTGSTGSTGNTAKASTTATAKPAAGKR